MFLLLQVVVEVGSQDDDFGIFTQRVVLGSTPYHIDVGVQLVEEFRNLRQLRHEERGILAGIDIK